MGENAQLALFREEPPPVRVEEVQPAASEREHIELANALPRTLMFGTSSWSFPGWAGLVYAGEYSERTLARHGLRAYAQHPLLRTVGLDRSYYEPLDVEQLSAYSAQLPRG